MYKCGNLSIKFIISVVISEIFHTIKCLILIFLVVIIINTALSLANTPFPKLCFDTSRTTQTNRQMQMTPAALYPTPFNGYIRRVNISLRRHSWQHLSIGTLAIGAHQQRSAAEKQKKAPTPRASFVILTNVIFREWSKTSINKVNKTIIMRKRARCRLVWSWVLRACPSKAQWSMMREVQHILFQPQVLRIIATKIFIFN